MNQIAQALTYSLPVIFALVSAYSYYGERKKLLLTVMLGLLAFLSILQVSFTMEFAWSRDFVNALWITIAASVLIFFSLTLANRTALEMTGLFLPLVTATVFFAMGWQIFAAGDQRAVTDFAPGSDWIAIHIVSAVGTYALLTIAACASLAVWVKEAALKSRSRNKIADNLPAVMAAERLQLSLLVLAEVLLAVSLASGMAVEYQEMGVLLSFSHKETFSLAAFALIAALLLAHHYLGIRGRRASRLLLTAYLCVVMGYPGVKLILDVLIV